MEKVFDAHTHTYPAAIAQKATVNLGAFYNFRVTREGTVDDLIDTSKRAGVGGFLILGVATNARQVRHVNDAVASDVMRAREAGLKAFGYAAFHQDMEDFSGELEHAVSIGLTGAKIHPDIQRVNIDDERLFPLYELLSECSLPICFHMGDDRPEYRYSEPERLVRVLDMFPRLRVLASHLGGWRAWDEALSCLAGRENIVYDASSSLWAMTPEFAAEIIRKLGVENVMFGTDYPVLEASEYLKMFDRLPLTESERRMVLYDNAARFFGFED